MNHWIYLSLVVLLGCSNLNTKPNWRTMDLNAQWIRQIGNQENLKFRKIARFTPLIYKDSVIVGSANDGISAVYRKSGTRKWFFPVKHGVEAGGALYQDQRVIFGGKDGYIYSVDAQTGKLIWRFFAKAEVLSGISVAGGQVFVLSGANVLYALDADDGKQNWVYSRVQRSRFSVRGGSQVLVKGQNLYLGFSDGFFVNLSARDGSLKWERKLSSQVRLQDVDMSPVADNKFVYTASYDGSLYALSLDGGEVAWRIEKGGFSKPALVNGKLLFPTSGKELLLVDARSGKIEWKLALEAMAGNPTTYENFWFIPLVSGKSLLIDSNTRKLLGKYEPGKGSLAGVAFDKDLGQFYLNSNAGNIHAVSYAWVDKRKKWSWEK